MLTVLLATRNRSRVLGPVLEAFTKLEPPVGGWKLVIVDNGSTDKTEDVVASFVERLPLQFLKEPRAGKNFALNAGLELIDGELTVLTDDDVFPQAEWLRELERAANEHREFSIFGGPITPCWEVDPPEWVAWTNMGAVFALTDPAWQDGPIPAHSVWGPNTAIRSSVFKSGIRFDTSIGPQGTNYVQGGDTELTRRLEKLGYRAWHVRSAGVRHFIRKEQFDKEWVLRRAIRHGRGEFRLGDVDELSTCRLLFGAPRHLFRELVREVYGMTKAWIRGRKDHCFRSRWRANFVGGKILEARSISRQRSSSDAPRPAES